LARVAGSISRPLPAPRVGGARRGRSPICVRSMYHSAAPAAATTAAGPMTLGLWDDGTTEEVAATAQPDPAQEFEAGRVALVAGRFDEAALRFGLALRLAPALAPAVLEATEGARASSLSVVRGDAYRLAGHETEALASYAIAARGGLPERRATVRVRPKPPPAAIEDTEESDEGEDDDEAQEGADAGDAAASDTSDKQAPDGASSGDEAAAEPTEAADSGN